MPTPPSSYSYLPLDFQHRTFRITILHPSRDFAAQICCDLVQVALDDHPKYEAISYVWGDPQDQVALLLEGATLMVTRNLDLALRYLRLPHEPRTLWVDAICIDQSNIEERSHQVRLMKDIYSGCTTDLVWLGESTRDTAQGIESLTQMKSLNLQRLTDRGRKDFNDRDALREFRRGDEWNIQSIISDPSLWSRVWVMQEIACSPTAMLIIGHFKMSWDVLSSILDHSGIPDRFHQPFPHQSYDKGIWDAFAKTQVIEHQRDILKGASPLHSTLLDVLARFRSTHSTDPRDKIYGLLGLASDDLGIIPDYSKSVRDVYIEIGRAQLNATQNLDLITQSLWPLGSTPSRDSSPQFVSSVIPATLALPSWLPNFSAVEAKSILFAQRSIFAAGSAKLPCPVSITTAGVLTISGTVLGSISTLKPVRRMIYSGGKYFSPYARDWLPSRLGHAYPTGGDAFEGFWRTLMTDCIAYPSHRLTEQDVKDYTEQFNEWRTKIATLPLTDRDKYDGDQDFLYKMGMLASELGIDQLIHKWRFAELTRDLYAMVPWEGSYKPDEGAKVGDVIVAARGGKVPLVLREMDLSDKREISAVQQWQVIGTAYVHGFMDGRAAKWAEEGIFKDRTFDVV